MTTVLIPTEVGDAHALAVERALESQGHTAIRWFGADYPQRQSSSFTFSDSAPMQWRCRGPALDVASGNFDTVWFRRPNLPYLPDKLLHPDDIWSATRELRSLFDSTWYTIGDGARWVNPPEGARRATSKLAQLKLAPEVGLQIPPTLVSNDPDDIRAFLRHHEPSGAIYKSFVPVGYREGEKILVGRTTAVALGDLPSDATLRLIPGIFQALIPKAFELRATFMGQHNVTLKICSQHHPDGTIDWRTAPLTEVPTELWTMPADVRKRCLLLMKRLGIVFGCFDFIVTPDERYIFLEVNEAGQFLFVEDLHPDAHLLDAFVEFLLSPTDSFRPTFKAPSVSFRDLQSDPSFLAQLRSEEAHHLSVTPPWWK